EAQFSSVKLTVLKNGDKVECLEENGRWMKINKDGVEGYVQKAFVGKAPNAVVTMGNSSMNDFVNMDVRKRASVYSTSAAAIRGLDSENVRERENMKFSNYDFESLKWIEENFNFSMDDFEGFYEK
ncbi:MAG: SH3 domain-containing protein, partial [Spirochaetales bacterium]|nr:SH3 domain-containing protein [Spirochaetales bacterium]